MSTPKNYKKTTLQRVGSWLHFALKMEVVFRTGSVHKITTIAKNLNMGPRASKMSPRASKMSPRASKMTKSRESNLPKTKSGTVAG